MKRNFPFLLMLLIIIIGLTNQSKNEQQVTNNNNNNKIDTNFISMMFEQEDGSYKEVNDSKFPTMYYSFNSKKSYCQNGSQLIWNNESKKINVKVKTSDKCYVYFDQEKTIPSLCHGKELASCIVKNYELDGNIIYHNLEDAANKQFPNYNLVANDDSYRYTGGGYILTAQGQEKYNSIYDIIIEKCGGSIQKNNYWCVLGSNFNLSYDNSNQDYSTLKLALTKAITDGYVQKNDINNYVCFGNDECSETSNYDNLYRIIGIFKNENDQYEAKLIKADYAGDSTLGNIGNFFGENYNSALYIGKQNRGYYYYWGNDMSWLNSSLNNINLNQEFLNKINNDYRKMISLHKWNIATFERDKGLGVNAKTAYEYELGEYKKENYSEKNVGLMYISDVYYAVPSNFWNYQGFSDQATGTIETFKDYRVSTWNNWLFLGNTEWLMSVENTYNIPYNFDFSGFLCSSNYSGNFAVRPSFYLNSSIKLVRGDGTITNPYRLSS